MPASLGLAYTCARASTIARVAGITWELSSGFDIEKSALILAAYWVEYS
jgi:hypothetical protein